LKVYVSRVVKFDQEATLEDNPKVDANDHGDSNQMELKDHSPPSSPTTSSSEGDEPIVPRSRRLSKLYESPNGLNLIFLLANFEPPIYHDAIKEKKWRQAMNEEIETIEKNQIWELTDLLKDKEVINIKLVHKAKRMRKGR